MVSKKGGKLSLKKKIIKKLAGDLLVIELLNLFVDVLPENEKKVLKMHFWEKLNFTEIGKRFNQRPFTVEAIYKKGLKRLKQKKRLILSTYKKKGD